MRCLKGFKEVNNWQFKEFIDRWKDGTYTKESYDTNPPMKLYMHSRIRIAYVEVFPDDKYKYFISTDKKK